MHGMGWGIQDVGSSTCPGHMVSRVLARSSFVNDMEIAAETLADLLASAIRRSTAEPRSFEQVFG